jgi:hypothetical protein
MCFLLLKDVVMRILRTLHCSAHQVLVYEDVSCVARGNKIIDHTKSIVANRLCEQVSQ